MRHILLLLLAIGLSACSSPYFEGRSPADVPAQINVINLKGVLSVDPSPFEGTDERGERKNTANSPPEVIELLSVIKRAIVNQFTNYGYKVVENESNGSDIGVKFVVQYTPEYGILVHRSVAFWAYAYDTEDRQLFKEFLWDQNMGGIFEALAVSRDEKISGAARKITVMMVEEMKKGTKGAAPPPPEPAKDTPKEEPKP